MIEYFLPGGYPSRSQFRAGVIGPFNGCVTNSKKLRAEVHGCGRQDRVVPAMRLSGRPGGACRVLPTTREAPDASTHRAGQGTVGGRHYSKEGGIPSLALKVR